VAASYRVAEVDKKQQQITLQPGSNQYTVDRRNFVSGSYIISVQQEEKRMEQGVKIIKQ